MTSWSPAMSPALDLESQQAAAGKIQNLLLDETPVIFSYFYDYPDGDEEGCRRRRSRQPWAS